VTFLSPFFSSGDKKSRRQGPALGWFAGFITDRSQSVSVADATSAAWAIACGVTQGSVLGPKQFITYTEDVADLLKRHLLTHRQYADDLHVMTYWSWPSKQRTRHSVYSACIIDVQSWCSSKRLQLNAGKTEIIWVRYGYHLIRLNVDDKCITIDSTVFEPSSVVLDLSVYFDAELSVRDHVIRIAPTSSG
jgi:Reverse transcriptase (RNA-dependent DNA polymerase)